jgi:hypothetical protein
MVHGGARCTVSSPAAAQLTCPGVECDTNVWWAIAKVLTTTTLQEHTRTSRYEPPTWPSPHLLCCAMGARVAVRRRVITKYS